MILKPIRLFDGEVLVEMRGGSPERFLNLCAARGLFLRKIRREPETCRCIMTAEEFLSCRPMARKAGVHLHVLRKRGLPFFLFRIRRRWGLPVGAALALGILAFCSTRLWDIELSGGSRHTPDQFTSLLAEYGVEAGVPLKEIACGDLEEAVRNTWPDILWVSIQKSGCVLRVQVRENEQWTEETEADSEETVLQATDLVAETDGIIESIVTRQGTPLVTAGDEVTAGQVLVSGIVPMEDDAGEATGAILVHADADITAITVEEYHWEREVTEETVTFGAPSAFALSLCVGSQRVTLSLGAESAQVLLGSWYSPRLFSYLPLPFSCEMQIGSSLIYTRRALSEEEIEALCQAEWEEFTENLREKGVQIQEKDVKVTVGELWLQMDGTVTLLGPLGEEKSSEMQTEEKENEETE